MTSPSVQRSFRLSRTTSDLLDDAAAAAGESRNAAADRLIGEAVRAERHPLVRFRSGSNGRREPTLVGTRLLVRQVVTTIHDHEGDGNDRIAAAAAYLDLPVRLISAAVSYYSEFTDEIDADIDAATRTEADERRRWEREKAAFA